MNRTILHSDMNGFYASVECLYDESIRNKPVVVAGDVEARHGIVLAKNEIAKTYGIATGNPVWQVRQVCPEAVIVLPHFDRYLKYSKLARDIYCEYTDRVESFGLDEAWLDVTESAALFGDGRAIANEIRRKIKSELGLTVSVGVSFNKIFAKLGSDIKKPDATTVITEDNFKERVWCLPVSDLLYVGRATRKKLALYGIDTIGDLANTPIRILERSLGKAGIMLWRYANGQDESPVMTTDSKVKIKSIGNSTTAPRDLVSEDDVKITLKVLCESVSSRLREQDMICRTVQLGIRSCELTWIERQMKLSYPNRTANELFNAAFILLKQNHDFDNDLPIRSLSVKACDLDKPEYEQLSFINDISKIQREENLEIAIDKVRTRFGHFSVSRGIMLTDRALSDLDPTGFDFRKNVEMGRGTG